MVQSKTLDIAAAMAGNEKSIIKLQNEHADSKNNVAYLSKNLQKHLESWMIGGPVAVLTSASEDSESNSIQFAIMNNR